MWQVNSFKRGYCSLFAKYPNAKIITQDPQIQFWTTNNEDWIILDISIGGPTKRIGVATKGDTPFIVQWNLDNFSKHSCDMIFIATRQAKRR